MNKGDTSNYTAHKKALPVVVAVLVTGAVTGYFMGLRQVASTASDLRQVDPFRTATAAAPAENGILVAVDYADMPGLQNRPNASWQSHLEKLAQPEPAPPPAHPATPEEREAARQERAANRAFDGAPPTIPHPIEQMSSMSCMACHGEGAVIKDRLATKISHPHWGSCTQCHVPSGSGSVVLDFVLNEPLAENQFVGAFLPPEGNRAFPGAPPSIPHPTALRQDCLSCHGPTGQPALRTTHPERQNCLQCHAPSAERDQRVFTADEPSFRELLDFLTHSEGGGP